MSVVGIDFGSHTASIALWFEEKNAIEVIADDLGSRTIPTAVAFRGDEIITGQAAVSQMHKNANNTFEDIRSKMLDAGTIDVNVPLLEKTLTVQELSSHFFRNIHNQIKQQVGKVVRECVISTPYNLSDDIKARLTESAQAGGMRIKACINDSVAALMAYQMDDASLSPGKTLVLDIGWSKTTISLFEISGGLFVPISSCTVPEACGAEFVKLIAAHCAKDFARKAKFPCDDNKRSMMRLRRECENAMKSLSTGAEATIDIDSLCEGVDFSLKLSRARFEDLLTIPFMQLKNGINSLLSSVQWNAADVFRVCMSGGGSAIPRVINTMKSMFSHAQFPTGRFESLETQCLGAALHGKFLLQQGLIDSAPVASPVAPCTTRPILFRGGTEGAMEQQVFDANTVLPTKADFPVALPAGQPQGYFQILAGPVEPADAVAILGEIVFTGGESGEEASNMNIRLEIDLEGAITIEVTQVSSGLILASLNIPPRQV
mmetsp:Transcript_15113/g.25194  ORF Transcript_15113/g.25194 Transcript_15113/m.25194 type:complete len:489 (+) Transcript_15113:776-2242(+)